MEEPQPMRINNPIIVEERASEVNSRNSLYCEEGDSEGSQSDFVHPFQQDHKNRKIEIVKGNMRRHFENNSNGQHIGRIHHIRGQHHQPNQLQNDINPVMPTILQTTLQHFEVQKPATRTHPSSPIDSLTTLQSGRYKRQSQQENNQIEGYSDVSSKKFSFNASHTLQPGEEEEPRHSSYGPRVKRYLTKSHSRGRYRIFEPEATVSKFPAVNKSYESNSLAKTAKPEKQKPRNLPPIPISKLISKYSTQQSPLSNSLNTLVNQIQTILQPTLKSYPFPLPLLSPLSSLKSSITKYLSTILNPPSASRQFSSELPPQKITEFLMSYQPRYKTLKNSKLMSQEGLSVKRYKNCAYLGGIKAGQKDGYGVVLYFGKNGATFEGKFLMDDRIEGLQTRQGQLYIGKFDNGLKDDQQGMLLANQRIYYGRFRKGLWVDHGISIGDDGLGFYSQEIDAFKNSQGDLFIGHLHSSNNEKYGFGVQFFNNGDVYVGNYELSKPEGYGQYYWWVTGANYRGSFLAGRRHGRGTWSIKDGDKYEGEYMNDRKCGQGIYTWSNGCQYKGQFENDLRHGYGEMSYPDGKVSKGSWVDGVQKERQYFSMKKTGAIETHQKPQVTYVPQNIYVHQNKVAGHIRINKTGYKKTRISKAMQIKLEKLTVSKELNTIDSNKEVPYRAERVFAQDQF